MTTRDTLPPPTWNRFADLDCICPSSSPLAFPRAMTWESTRTRSLYNSRYSSASTRNSLQALIQDLEALRAPRLETHSTGSRAPSGHASARSPVHLRHTPDLRTPERGRGCGPAWLQP